ncbi:hypothetical protein Pint_32872 [Pistacia integerrima]|uniref:Uncharacterized protein n=1 Tax=Pistacia integerrima TaxID=434235 RepID=A0ACC0X794_9ROSI|nr:hypothetical protein Pint_32872 [Pistacia integerrima]
MFGDQVRLARREAIQRFINLRQGAMQPVQEHNLNVMVCLNKAEILCSIIDPETQTYIVLASLNHSLSQFKLDYELNHKEYCLVI